MTSKEALEHIIFDAKMEKPIFSMYYQEFLKPIEKDLERLEKLEKAIEIIKKAFGLHYILEYDNYNYSMAKEEYELLKEVLQGGK